DAVRPEEPVPRSEVQPRRSAVVARGREARPQDAAPRPRRDARGAGARGHGDAAARESPFDHAGHAVAMEGGAQVAAALSLPPDLLPWITYAALGVFVGFFSGLLGIGGGSMIVPV